MADRLEDRLREAGWYKHANNDDVLMLEAADEIGALRGALQGLVDATDRGPATKATKDNAFWREIAAARAVAVAVLTGQETGLTGENLRDSGVREPGGVSDGPQ